MMPRDVRLPWFAEPRRVLTTDPQWGHVREWYRKNLVSMKPLANDEAEVELTEIGREKAGL
jgi:hypothetical protein